MLIKKRQPYKRIVFINKIRLHIEPSVRFELTCSYETGLQNQCNQPLCKEGRSSVIGYCYFGSRPTFSVFRAMNHSQFLYISYTKSLYSIIKNALHEFREIVKFLLLCQSTDLILRDCGRHNLLHEANNQLQKLNEKEFQSNYTVDPNL